MKKDFSNSELFVAVAEIIEETSPVRRATVNELKKTMRQHAKSADQDPVVIAGALLWRVMQPVYRKM